MIKIGTQVEPKTAQMIYSLGKLASAIVGIFFIAKGIDAGAAEHLEQIIAGFVALFPAASNKMAQDRVTVQRKEGQFTPLSPSEQIAKGYQEYQALQETFNQEAAKVTGIVGSVANQFGPLATAAMSIPNLVPVSDEG